MQAIKQFLVELIEINENQIEIVFDDVDYLYY